MFFVSVLLSIVVISWIRKNLNDIFNDETKFNVYDLDNSLDYISHFQFADFIAKIVPFLINWYVVIITILIYCLNSYAYYISMTTISMILVARYFIFVTQNEYFSNSYVVILMFFCVTTYTCLDYGLVYVLFNHILFGLLI
jgi:hypothetical protein